MTHPPNLPTTGFIRVAQLIGPGNPLPISRATFYSWAALGVLKPVPLGPGRITGVRVEDVRAFLANPTAVHEAAKAAAKKQPPAATARQSND